MSCALMYLLSLALFVFFFLFRTYFYYAIFITIKFCSNSYVFHLYVNLIDHTKYIIYIYFFMYQPFLLFFIGTLLLICDTDYLFLSPIIHRRLKNTLHLVIAYVMFKSSMLYLSQNFF